MDKKKVVKKTVELPKKKLQEIKLKEDKAVKCISDLPAEGIAKALHTALAKSKEKEKDN